MPDLPFAVDGDDRYLHRAEAAQRHGQDERVHPGREYPRHQRTATDAGDTKTLRHALRRGPELLGRHRATGLVDQENVLRSDRRPPVHEGAQGLAPGSRRLGHRTCAAALVDHGGELGRMRVVRAVPGVEVDHLRPAHGGDHPVRQFGRYHLVPQRTHVDPRHLGGETRPRHRFEKDEGSFEAHARAVLDDLEVGLDGRLTGPQAADGPPTGRVQRELTVVARQSPDVVAEVVERAFAVRGHGGRDEDQPLQHRHRAGRQRRRDPGKDVPARRVPDQHHLSESGLLDVRHHRGDPVADRDLGEVGGLVPPSRQVDGEGG